MKKFRVRVKETYVCYVDVEAGNMATAKEIVEKQLDDCEVIVPRDYGDMDRNISVVRELKDGVLI